MWRARWLTIVDQIRVVSTPDEDTALPGDLAAGGEARVVGFVNAHAMNGLADDRVFFDALHGANLLLRDGSGMSALFRNLGRDPGRNMNGTDLIPRLLDAFEGRPVALWGTREPFLSVAAEAARTRFGVEVVSVADGFRPDDAYPALFAESAPRPDLVVLGMGMPKQERVAGLVRAVAAGHPVCIVCGGAILDFLAGRVPRAPLWMRRLGIEWLYRLRKEPARLFRRYVIGNPKFLWRARRLARHLRRTPHPTLETGSDR